jgi:polyphosphate kinase 2 (PPK2 family)
MKRKAYEQELRKLQVQLCHLQEWVKEKKLRVIVLFEGRDAAGKGGTIKAITEKVSPRVFRVVARRLIARNRKCSCSITCSTFRQEVKSSSSTAAGTTAPASKYVMGFCTPDEHRRFLSLCPQIEKYVVDAGIPL